MGAALTYARRYALFALVGIAGEDDLDAPDLAAEPTPASQVADGRQQNQPDRQKPPNGSIHKPRQPKPVLAADASAALRDQLVAEIVGIKAADDLALWAHRILPAKNTLAAADARAVEDAYQTVLDALNRSTAEEQNAGRVVEPAAAVAEHHGRESRKRVTPLRKMTCHRNKAHLAFVAAQPCLVCQRSPGDAHHLKFAQPRSLGRKVSDEFTVPLCRQHHQDLHHQGNEIAWWADLQIVPMDTAKQLWAATQSQGGASGYDSPSPESRSETTSTKLDSNAESQDSRYADGRTSP